MTLVKVYRFACAHFSSTQTGSRHEDLLMLCLLVSDRDSGSKKLLLLKMWLSCYCACSVIQVAWIQDFTLGQL